MIRTALGAAARRESWRSSDRGTFANVADEIGPRVHFRSYPLTRDHAAGRHGQKRGDERRQAGVNGEQERNTVKNAQHEHESLHRRGFVEWMLIVRKPGYAMITPPASKMPGKPVGRWASAMIAPFADQNAGTTAPLYLVSMNFFTSSLCSAATSFFTASLSLLSGRETIRLA
jgi:hypothetical protein